MPVKKYYSIREVAEYFGVSRQTVNNMVRDGRIAAVRVLNRRMVVKKTEIERYERENTEKVKPKRRKAKK